MEGGFALLARGNRNGAAGRYSGITPRTCTSAESRAQDLSGERSSVTEVAHESKRDTQKGGEGEHVGENTLERERERAKQKGREEREGREVARRAAGEGNRRVR